MTYFPVDLLRTFVATADCGSMAKSARIVGLTPSAVSLQMTKLASLVGHPLFQKRARVLVLTAAGEALIGHAREVLKASERAVAAMGGERLEGPVRFGTVQDLADTLLPRALADFARRHEGVTVHVQVARSHTLLEQVRSGDLDFVVCFAGTPELREIRREPMVWLGHREVAARDPLPLAMLDPSCAYGEAAEQALRRMGRRYEVVLRTPSLLGLRGALEAGFAIGCRTELMKSGSIEVLGAKEGLPELPEMPFALYIPRPLGAAARQLAGVVRAALTSKGRSTVRIVS
jgi:DNA-binding transcriptional LysR family regulator